MSKSVQPDVKGIVHPLNDRVLVKKIKPEEFTSGGIYVAGGPDAERAVDRGEVIAVGPGVLLKNGDRATPQVDVGDKVIFGKYAGTEIVIHGVSHWIMEEKEILSTFKGS